MQPIQTTFHGLTPYTPGEVDSRPNKVPRFGFSLGPTVLLASLEASPIAQLAVTDLGAMVFPRTYIEWKKRGKVAAAEAFARELAGTVTNTFLMGLLGLGVAQFFKSPRFNPKGMDISSAAHIDASMLGHFEGITKRLLEETEGKNISAEQFKREFLKTVFGQLQSTDHIPEYAIKNNIHGIFPKDGKLTQPALDKIVQEYETSMLNESVMPRVGRLASVQRLRKMEAQTRTDWTKKLEKLAVTEGKITERVFIDPEKQHARDLSNVFETTRNYLEEFLNRAIYETKTETSGLTNDAIIKMRKALFAESGKNIWQHNVKPVLSDGLIHYAYKTKNSTVLIPFALTLGLGGSFVFIKNWITRLRTNIKNFPGEEALRNQEELRNSLSQKWNNNPPSNPWQARPYATMPPRFAGFTSSAPALTRMLDFQSMGSSTVFQNMVIYAGVIASRVLGARGHNEKMEIERQDFTGYYNWFFGTSLIQVGMVGLMSLMFKPARDLLITPMVNGAHKTIEGIARMFTRPNSVWKIATLGQLKNRQAQLLEALNNKTLSETTRRNLEGLEDKLSKAIKVRPWLFGTSILLSSISLGVLIPYYNVWRTRANIRKQMHPLQPSVAFQHPIAYGHPQPGMTQAR